MFRQNEKIGLYRYVSDFSFDDDTIDVDDHLDIHKYFMKKKQNIDWIYLKRYWIIKHLHNREFW